MKTFIKGMIVGLGAVAPGLSGSVLLVIFGLYQKTITAISGLFQNFKRNVLFLLPLAAGIGTGIVLFSMLVDHLLTTYEMQTRFAFLGMILGSIPLFYREVKKEGFRRGYYAWMALAFLFGLILFNFNRNLFPVVKDPSLLQCVLLGVAVAASYIVPGVDSAAILSALGLYNLWVHALATFNFKILFPAFLGAAAGVLVVSNLINWLIKRFYTPTFSVIFGLFLSVVPAVFNESCVVEANGKTAVSLVLLAVSFLASLAFSNWESLRERCKKK